MLNLHYENNSYICTTIYDLKDFPKDAGFNWNKDKKGWTTTSFVSVLNLLEDLKTNEQEYTTTSDFDFQSDIAEKALKEFNRPNYDYIIEKVKGVYNEPVFTDLAKKAFESLDSSAKNIITPPAMGSEDFSIYQQYAPGAMGLLGIGNKEKQCIYCKLQKQER